MNIIYEDKEILVCEKEAGIPVQSANLRIKDMESQIKNYLSEKQGGGVPYLGIIHRLDQPVQGVLVFGKTHNAAKNLSAQISTGKMKKFYQAIVCGIPTEKEAELVDFLIKDGKANTSKAVSEGTKEAKKAKLTYRVLKEKMEPSNMALVEIQLFTGRHHQIRVQMAKAGMPLLGDTKYNPSFADGKNVQTALCAVRLTFAHPQTGEAMTFSCEPTGEVWNEI